MSGSLQRGTNDTEEWKSVSDPKQASCIFSQQLLHRSKDAQSLFLSVDIRQNVGKQDRALVKFYSRDNIRWASPLYCKLQGDVATGSGVDRHMMSTVILKLISGFHLNSGSAAVTKVFEGEPDHLIPSMSEELLHNDMFTVAGRMMGHSFLRQGPSFPGLSPAIIHILFGGSLETTPVSVRDCPDLHIRDAVEMLDGEGELDDSIVQFCLSWNLPAPNINNRKCLSRKLLLQNELTANAATELLIDSTRRVVWKNYVIHVLQVIGQTRCQIDQLRKGLQETGLWPLVTHRRDVIPILFPRESEAQITPQMILDCIIWPSCVTIFFESFKRKEVDECNYEDVDRVSGYLKTFIENACAAELKSLVKFWIGWEVPAREMKVEIVDANFPSALTCFEKLRLPRHHTAYTTFHQDLSACIAQHSSGFGCQ